MKMASFCSGLASLCFALACGCTSDKPSEISLSYVDAGAKNDSTSVAESEEQKIFEIDPLIITPIEKPDCNGACNKVPKPGDSFKCVETTEGQGCYPVKELACTGGVDDDLDGLTDCSDKQDCSEDLYCLVPCGNNQLDQSEDCDGGNNCLQTCKCPTGNVPDGAKGCKEPPPACGDSKLDQGEECDGGPECLQTCKCSAGKVPDGNGGCTAPVCQPNCSGKVCGPDGCGGDCGSCQSGEICTIDQLCLPQPVTATNGEKQCDDGIDNDKDNLIDAADPDCLKLPVATLGITFYQSCVINILTGDGESWQSNVPAPEAGKDPVTLSIKIDGSDKKAQIWLQKCKGFSATSPQGFVIWQNGGAQSYPAWPASDVPGLKVAKGKSFSASSESSFNIELK